MSSHVAFAAAEKGQGAGQGRGADVDELPLLVGAHTAPDLTFEQEERLAALLDEADGAEAANDVVMAARYLRGALAIAPNDVELQLRAKAVEARASTQRAARLLDEAMRRGQADAAAAAEMVREAVRLSSERKVLSRAVEALVFLGARDDACRAGQYLVALYPDDAAALLFLFETHVGAGRFAVAMPYGEALARLNPDDARLRERLAKVAIAARR